MRYLTDREQSPRRVSRGMWKHGKKHGAAVCAACRDRVQPGQWVKAAPGFAGTVRHVACQGGGRA